MTAEEIPAEVLERHRTAARLAGADPGVVDASEYRESLARRLTARHNARREA